MAKKFYTDGVTTIKRDVDAGTLFLKGLLSEEPLMLILGIKD